MQGSLAKSSNSNRTEPHSSRVSVTKLGQYGERLDPSH